MRRSAPEGSGEPSVQTTEQPTEHMPPQPSAAPPEDRLLPPKSGAVQVVDADVTTLQMTRLQSTLIHNW